MHQASVTSPMEFFIFLIGVGLLLLMFIPLYRVVRGPTVITRILGVNVIGTKTIVMVVIIGTIYGQVEMFVDIAITYAMLNFIASLAAARFLHRYHQEDIDENEKEMEGDKAC